LIVIQLLASATNDGHRPGGSVLAAEEAFLEPLSPRQRDSVAAALKQLLLRSEPG
jgi:hypothetical protein